MDPLSIAALLSGAVGLGGMIFGDDGSEEAEKAAEKLARLSGDPEYQAKYLGGWTPDEREAALVSEDPGMKQLQTNYLQSMLGLSEEGLSDEDLAIFSKAQQEADQRALAQSNTLMQQMRERGIGDSGAALAMRQAASQDATTRQANANMDQAAQAARQKALYTQAYGNALGGVRDQDFRTQAANQEAINKFNAMGSDATNQARRDDVQARQAIANANVAQKYAGAAGQAKTAGEIALAQGAANQQFNKALIGAGTDLFGYGYGRKKGNE